MLAPKAPIFKLTVTLGVGVPLLNPCSWKRLTGFAPPKLSSAVESVPVFELKFSRNSLLTLLENELVAPNVYVRVLKADDRVSDGGLVKFPLYRELELEGVLLKRKNSRSLWLTI